MPGVMETEMMEEVILANSFEFDRKKFLKTETVAKFVKYLMSNKLSEHEFENHEWDIYDRKHHKFWMEINDFVPLEAPKPSIQ
jgi:benzil reductase ((S)-benzoin forming)